MALTRRPEYHGHASLRFDADPRQTARYLARVILANGIKLLTTTEARGNRALVRYLRANLPDSYRVVRRNQYLIVWHHPTYRPHALSGLALLDPRTWVVMGHDHEFTVARKRFRHRATGTLLRVEVTHVPSGIAQGPGVWSAEHPDRVRIAQTGLARMGRRIARFQRRHPDRALFAHMDSNLDQLRPSWRTYLTHTLRAPSVWDLTALPPMGTHGLRLIDTAHIAGPVRVTRASVVHLARPPKLDHRPFLYRVEYTTT